MNVQPIAPTDRAFAHPDVAARGRAIAVAVGLLALVVTPAAPAAGARTVDERRAADPQGTVTITNVAGRVEIVGWDRAEVQVTGRLGAGVERLEFTGDGGRTEIRVVLPKSRWNDDGTAELTVRVPARSAVSAQVVSADLRIAGVTGRAQLQSVSGNVTGTAARDARVRTVSGDLQLEVRGDAGRLELATVSGDLRLDGSPGGEVDVGTVSGDATLRLGTVTRGRFKSVSGDVAVTAGLGPDARVEVETVSGDVRFDVVGKPAGAFEVDTLSGDIDNCFGPKPVEAKYGPGTRLSFREGAATGEVRIDTKSGDVGLCTAR